MALINNKAPIGYKPKVGDLIHGKIGYMYMKGQILPCENNPKKPQIKEFKSFVGILIETLDKKQPRYITEVCPLNIDK